MWCKCWAIGQTFSHHGPCHGQARDVQFQGTVALKSLPEDFTANLTEREGLFGEARAASARDHPNTGVIYDLEHDNACKYFISMSSCDMPR